MELQRKLMKKQTVVDSLSEAVYHLEQAESQLRKEVLNQQQDKRHLLTIHTLVNDTIDFYRDVLTDDRPYKIESTS